ncbi:Pre-mRNA cleavage complex 2 protein Pcf11 [Nymphon striatum]|nr:Pre-mRNA cleavage complex 2 protein Pcf11 [Nymphon striatum]
MAELLCTEYKSSLEDLKCNSKPLINCLTMLAEEHIAIAPKIVQVIEAHLRKVQIEHKLPVIYLVDSIIKNVGKDYLHLFRQNIVSNFCSVFEKGDEKVRVMLFKVRQTWTEIFTPQKLLAIDTRVNQLDPAWPIVQPEVVRPSIHVNPKFLENSSKKEAKVPSLSETEMKEKLKEKQQELLRLQNQTLELELSQTKARLKEQVRKFIYTFNWKLFSSVPGNAQSRDPRLNGKFGGFRNQRNLPNLGMSNNSPTSSNLNFKAETFQKVNASSAVRSASNVIAPAERPKRQNLSRTVAKHVTTAKPTIKSETSNGKESNEIKQLKLKPKEPSPKSKKNTQAEKTSAKVQNSSAHQGEPKSKRSKVGNMFSPKKSRSNSPVKKDSNLINFTIYIYTYALTGLQESGLNWGMGLIIEKHVQNVSTLSTFNMNYDIIMKYINATILIFIYFYVNLLTPIIRNIFVLFLDFDGEEKLMKINGIQHSFKFGGPTRELIVDNKPYEGKFGGPPIWVKLDGEMYRIRLQGPTPTVKVTPLHDREVLDEVHTSDFRHKNSLNERLEGPDNHSSYFNEYPPSRRSQNASWKADTPPPITQNQLNISQNVNIYIFLFYTLSLKPHEGILESLYTGTKCESCGVRFTPENMDKYSHHLDWHFRANRREKDSAKKAHSRKWYFDVEDWIQFEEIEDTNERAVAEEQCSKSEATEVPTVPASEDEQENMCSVCKEQFEIFWDENDELWRLKEAIEVDGKRELEFLKFEATTSSSILPGLDLLKPEDVETPTVIKSEEVETLAVVKPEDIEAPLIDLSSVKNEPESPTKDNVDLPACDKKDENIDNLEEPSIKIQIKQEPVDQDTANTGEVQPENSDEMSVTDTPLLDENPPSPVIDDVNTDPPTPLADEKSEESPRPEPERVRITPQTGSAISLNLCKSTVESGLCDPNKNNNLAKEIPSQPEETESVEELVLPPPDPRFAVQEPNIPYIISINDALAGTLEVSVSVMHRYMGRGTEFLTLAVKGGH